MTARGKFPQGKHSKQHSHSKKVAKRWAGEGPELAGQGIVVRGTALRRGRHTDCWKKNMAHKIEGGEGGGSISKV